MREIAALRVVPVLPVCLVLSRYSEEDQVSSWRKVLTLSSVGVYVARKREIQPSVDVQQSYIASAVVFEPRPL